MATEKNSKDEAIFAQLRALYESYGYKQYRMRKFEEYALYLANKSFLTDESFITFNDPRGKLLALKPDVTLSIAKQTVATQSVSEKLYYKESVYRLDKRSNEYKEISQIGVELLGQIGVTDIVEMLYLICGSLEIVSADFILDISHMGIINGILKNYDVKTDVVKELLACVSSKNADGLQEIAGLKGVDDGLVKTLKVLCSGTGGYAETIALLKSIATNKEAKKGVQTLEAIGEAFRGTEYEDKLHLDFSIINDIDYYNGIIVQGYVKGVAKAILSGGQYDRLVKYFKKDVNAMGFALYLDELNTLFDETGAFDVDILLKVASEDKTAREIMSIANALRGEGKSVRMDRDVPQDVRYKELVEI